LSLIVPHGEMRAAFAELLGINASAGLLRLLSGDQSKSEIRCAVADFDVAGGIARARTFVIDTDVVLARGSGSIDLGAETLNLKIDGDSKKPRLLRLWTPIYVRARWPRPAYRRSTPAGRRSGRSDGHARRGGQPVAALFAFVDPGLAKDADCGALIQHAG
jgi:uncharacterized protein involved in outer membrane biogenesis